MNERMEPLDIPVDVPVGGGLSERFEVGAGEARWRLDAWLVSMSGIPRSEIQRLISSGRVRVDGTVRRKSHVVAAGEVVEVSGLAAHAVSPSPAPFEVRFEDEHLAVVSKPPGVVVHPAPGTRSGTLVESLATRMPLAPAAGEGRPGVVHRLDKDTSGLLVFAKHDQAYRGLVEAIKDRRIRRRYIAMVVGAFELPAGRIEAPVGRLPRARARMGVTAGGREAVTEFRVVEKLGCVTMIEVHLETGRTHQIRVHLSHINHPVVGDSVYGKGGKALARQIGLDRPFLHAASLAFPHPILRDDVLVTEKLPRDLEQALEAARLIWCGPAGGDPGGRHGDQGGDQGSLG